MSDNEQHDSRALLDFCEPRPESRSLGDGELLIAQHGAGTDVFVLLDGALDASIKSGEEIATVARFEKGDLIGELTAISGGPRTATVTAVGPASVAVVKRDQFIAWLDSEPQRYQRVAAQARDRIDRNRAAAMLARVLGSDHPGLLALVLPMVQWRTLQPGEVLCREGDESGAAYLILSGRLAVTSDHSVGRGRTVELGRNQIVGELGVLDRLPRTATVIAQRRTNLAELPAEAIDAVVNANPNIALHLFRQALARALNPEPRSATASAVGLVITTPGETQHIVAVARNELERHGSVAVIDAAAVDSALGQSNIANTPRASVSASRVNEWLHDLETSHDYLMMVGTAEASEWTIRLADMADRTLIISSAHPDKDELKIVNEISEELSKHSIPWWRGVRHPATTTNPANHLAQLADGQKTLHLRERNDSDLRRAIRLLSGNGIGLALGGGGARGFGHVGAYKALKEAGIEPDVIVGASIGAVAGMAIALDWSFEQQREFLLEGFENLLDWTLPVVSFLKGKRITESIEEKFGGYRCEALWRPFSCSVTNLTRSSVEFRSEGSAARAVRTSVSIPGVLPVITENGEVFVDGGVLNNLPADALANDPNVRTVFAIDVSPPSGPRVKQETKPSVSGLSVLARKAGRRSVWDPSSAAIVMQTMVAGSDRDRRALMEDGTIDHYMHLDIRGSSLLAFDNIDPVIDQGYASAKKQLAEWGMTS